MVVKITMSSSSRVRENRSVHRRWRNRLARVPAITSNLQIAGSFQISAFQLFSFLWPQAAALGRLADCPAKPIFVFDGATETKVSNAPFLSFPTFPHRQKQKVKAESRDFYFQLFQFQLFLRVHNPHDQGEKAFAAFDPALQHGDAAIDAQALARGHLAD